MSTTTQQPEPFIQCGMAWGGCEEGHAHDCGVSLTAEGRHHTHRCAHCGKTWVEPIEIPRADIRKGDVIRFRPRGRRNRVMVNTVSGYDGYGWVLGYRTKLEGTTVVSRGMEPSAYAVPDMVELVRR